MTSGESIAIPLCSKLRIIFPETNNIKVVPNISISIPYTIKNASSAVVVTAIGENNIITSITEESKNSGYVSVLFPSNVDFGKVVVLVTDNGNTITETLHFVAGSLITPTKHVINYPGGIVEFDIETDMEVDIQIPEEHKMDISILNINKTEKGYKVYSLVNDNTYSCSRNLNININYKHKGVIKRVNVFQYGGTYNLYDIDGHEIKMVRITVNNSNLNKEFYLCTIEVTQELYEFVTSTNPSCITGDKDYPVVGLTYTKYLSFIKTLNDLSGQEFRIPTGEEWKYAMQGGDKSLGYKYSGSDDADEVAWYQSNSDNTVHAVAQKAPNELGLYDMSGNVSELVYVEDDYDKYIYYGSNYLSSPGMQDFNERTYSGNNNYFYKTRSGLRLAIDAL